MRYRILIVEDEAVLRKHLARLLVHRGYEVTTAGSRAEAFDELARVRFDAILLDVRLPDGDGLDLLGDLGDQERPPHVVVMTAYSSPENEVRAGQLGVACLLRKPLDLHQVVGAVRPPSQAACSA